MCSSVPVAGKNDSMLILSSRTRHKWSLCVVIAGWQGDAVLALLAGLGPCADCVFTQRLRLDGVSGTH